MTPRIVLPLLAALAVAMLAGCPKGEDQPATTASATPAAASPAASPATPRLAGADDGEILYRNRCQACHGSLGIGGLGPALAAVDKKGHAYVTGVIREGRPTKGMPAFAGQLQPAEIEAVARFVEAL